MKIAKESKYEENVEQARKKFGSEKRSTFILTYE